MSTHWISKYALSSGIFELKDAEITGSGYLSKMEQFPSHYHFYSPKDFHSTREMAVARAREMRTKKVSSLKKQIAKLEKMTFKEGP